MLIIPFSSLRRSAEKVSPFLVIALILAFCIEGAWGLKADLGGDATQNFLSSYNFYSNFEYGHDIGDPGYRREPFPNWFLAAFLWLFYRPISGLTKEQVLDNVDILNASVHVNVLWAGILFFAVWGLCRSLFSSSLMADFVAINSIIISQSSFVKFEYPSLNTELPAAAMIAIFSLSLTISLLNKTPISYLFVGLSYGLLVLTKASGAYIGFAVIPLIACLFSVKARTLYGFLSTKFLRILLLITLGFSLMVAPWVCRNYFEFGRPAIAEGGGRVLWIRSEFNKINSHQYFGAFYAYSPELVRESVWENILGNNPSQLECGGDLQLHNRGESCDKYLLSLGRAGDIKQFDKVVSLYERGKKALPEKMKAEARAAGVKFDLDQEGKKIFLDGLRNQPLNHVLLTIPLAWRGVWSFGHSDWTGVIVNFLVMVNLIFLPVIAMALKNKSLLLLSLAPAGYFWFYALLSQFWPRFAEPFIPIGCVLFAYTLAICIQKYPLNSSKLTSSVRV